MKKTLHIVPHTHWDREWYMSFEQHRFRMVEFLDTLMDTMERDEGFRTFHLDGQTVLLRDYLHIRPERRETLLGLLRSGRIQTGPWYVLQDEFLTSGEASIRNMQTGLRICRELEVEPSRIGYFPDAFGNISQVPQLLCGFGIDCAVMGRGIDVESPDRATRYPDSAAGSEMIWRSPDGSEVMGVLMPNWYNNASELPLERAAARQRVDELVESISRFAGTPHLLGMNGSDHQPIQTNLAEVVAAMQECAPEIEIKISSLTEYLAAIKPYREGFSVIEGELAGQKTCGWGLLENTASSRIDLKKKNDRAQNLLEREAEPFGVLSVLAGGKYDRGFLRYAWETLMENHPHDSICCCSVDDVHREMNVRFDKSMQVSALLAERAITHLAGQIDTAAVGTHNLVVLNKEPYPVTGRVDAYVDFPEEATPGILTLFDAARKIVPAVIGPSVRTFTYRLPDDKFRETAYVNRRTVSFAAEQVPPLGWAVYTLREAAAPELSLFPCGEREAENEFLRLRIEENGTLTLQNKASKKNYTNFLYIEDAPDCGDEYTYRLPAGGGTATTLDAEAQVSVAEHTPFSVTYRVSHALRCPIDHYVTLTAGVPRVDVRTVIDNRICDHRVRACFDTALDTDSVYADGQFDIPRRDITVWQGWNNPLHTQRCQHFFEVTDGTEGVLIAGKGLHEYEILPQKNTMALTLLRAIGQLGDWGEFPTPDSQISGLQEAEYAIVLYGAEGRAAAHKAACAFSEEALRWTATGCHDGSLLPVHSAFAIAGDFIRLSALKRCEERETTLLRLYNSSETEQNAVITVPAACASAYSLNLAEERQEPLPLERQIITLTVPAKKIVTIELIEEIHEQRGN